MAEPERPIFSVEAGILRVERELDEVEPEELEHAVRQLVRSGVAAPVVDLGGVTFLPSWHVDGIRTVADECLREGRSLTVRAPRNVKIMLERMGLGAVARLKVAEDDARGPGAKKPAEGQPPGGSGPKGPTR